MMKTQTSSLQPCRKGGIEEELIDQELFLHDTRNDAVHCLNSGAALIWALCDGRRDLTQIAGEIAEGSGLPAPQLLTEVQETVAQLQALELLEP